MVKAVGPDVATITIDDGAACRNCVASYPAKKAVKDELINDPKTRRDRISPVLAPVLRHEPRLHQQQALREVKACWAQKDQK